MNNFFQSKAFKKTIVVIAIILVLLVVFDVGMAVGFRKASFSYHWSDNYHRNFAGPAHGFEDYLDGGFISGHGIFGTIIKTDGTSTVIEGTDKVENIILADPSTVIERLHDNLKPSDLNVGDVVVVIGSPNSQGEIQAKLIRVMPPPPTPGQQIQGTSSMSHSSSSVPASATY